MDYEKKMVKTWSLFHARHQRECFLFLSKSSALNLSRLFQIAFFQYPVVLNLGQLFIPLQQPIVSTTKVAVGVFLLQ